VPCTLELGGKSALVVFDDAEVEKAVEWAMFGCFWTNGQICSATSRVLVQDGIAPRFLELLARRAGELRLAPPLDPEGQVGPLVCESQYRKVVGYIERARRSQAHLLCGGAERPAGLGGGFYVRPTVFTDVPVDGELWTEEVFGPVMAVRTFASEREAVDLANASEFGLAAAVISRDRARCERLARDFEAGIVWQNCSQPCFPQLPWGGGKRSGYGRELSRIGLENFQHVKQICSYESDDVWDWYSPPGPRAKL
jgi:betaine-aldehyde dehydrogenase